MRQLFERAQRDHDMRQKALAGKDRAAAATIVARTEERHRLVAELREIDAAISAIRDSVLETLE